MGEIKVACEPPMQIWFRFPLYRAMGGCYIFLVMRKVVFVTIPVLLLAAVVLNYVLSGRSSSGNPRKSVGIFNPGSVGRIEGFSYTHTAGNRVEWEIHSEMAEYFREKNETVFEGIKAVFYPESGGEVSIEGRKGVMHTDSKNVELEGNLIARSDRGYRLLTNSLSYDNDSRVISTQDPVVFFGNGISVNGAGMTISVRDEKLTLNGPVRAVAWNLHGLKSPKGTVRQ